MEYLQLSKVYVNSIHNKAGTQAMSIDGSGNIDVKGHLTQTNPICWETSRNSTVSTDGAIWIPNNIEIDTHSAISTSTGKFTAPVAGYYYTQFTWLSNSNAELSDVYIKWTNSTGSTMKRIRSQGHSNHISMSGHRIMYLDVGDELWIENGNGVIYGDANWWTSWSGHFIG